MRDIVNPATHTHRPDPADKSGNRVCIDCRAVLVEPLLDGDHRWDDIDNSADMGLDLPDHIRFPMPLDAMMFWLHSQGAIECPDYICLVSDAFNADEFPEHHGHTGPPHTTDLELTDWWVSE